MRQKKDIMSQTFGYLKVIRCTDKKYRGSYIWEFECQLCGKRIEQRIGQVTSGQIVSCGCYRNKNLEMKSTSEKVGFVNGTNISKIKSQVLPRNNTSGHKGVYLQKGKSKPDKWCAYIYFQKKRYYLGTFTDKEDAIKARELAEEKLYGNFINQYEGEINNVNKRTEYFSGKKNFC